jgi:hypothetical protein
MKHHCHAHKCSEPTEPRMFVCLRHWKQLTPELKNAVWATYRRGQEYDKNPSVAYIKAVNNAKLYLAEKEYPQDIAGLKNLYAKIEQAFGKREAV